MIRIIIITYNACNELSRCINSILNCNAGSEYKISIYDNHSSDHTPLWLKENAALGFEYQCLKENHGFSKAANIAARESDEELLIFLDDDVVVTDNWLGVLQQTILSSPRVGLVGCRFLDSQQRIYYAETRCGPLRTLRRNELDIGQGQYTKETDVVVGACWMVRRALFEEIGGLDEKFYPAQFEDIDFCLRVRLAGYTIIYQGELTLQHINLHRAGGRETHLANRLYFYRKWGTRLSSFPLESSHVIDHLASQAIRHIAERKYQAALDCGERIRSIGAQFQEPLIEYWALSKAGFAEQAQQLAKELLRLNPENIFVRLQMIDPQIAPLSNEQRGVHAKHLLDAFAQRVRSGISEKPQVKPITPSSPDLWKKFIDPVDWQTALETFPEEPWRLYIKPVGDYEEHHWAFFVRAVTWVWNKADQARMTSDYSLTLKDILSINSLILNGTTERWQESLRDYRPIFNRHTQEEIDTIYEAGTSLYKNHDQLRIRIDGFLPCDNHSIEFFLICRKLGKVRYHENPEEWLELSRQFRQQLKQQIDHTASEWNVYYLSNTQELSDQVNSILSWYNEAAEKLATAQPDAVLELAVKMQRYLDICQFCVDGSGRTSKLISDYIFLIFGLNPPNPTRYFFAEKAHANGTYIPLANAIEMAQLGWENMPPIMATRPTDDTVPGHSAARGKAAIFSAPRYTQNE